MSGGTLSAVSYTSVTEVTFCHTKIAGMNEREKQNKTNINSMYEYV